MLALGEWLHLGIGGDEDREGDEVTRREEEEGEGQEKIRGRM